MTLLSTKSPEEIRAYRSRTPRGCGLIHIASLWPKTGENLGTLVRTADAIGGCLVVPSNANAAEAIRRGNTLGMQFSPVHWIDDPLEYLADQYNQNTRIVAVELAHGAIPLRDVEPVYMPTVLVLGHERHGVPREAWPFIDQAIEIPMVGVGNSLNVAVAGSLAAYKLAGMS